MAPNLINKLLIVIFTKIGKIILPKGVDLMFDNKMAPILSKKMKNNKLEGKIYIINQYYHYKSDCGLPDIILTKTCLAFRQTLKYK